MQNMPVDKETYGTIVSRQTDEAPRKKERKKERVG